MQTTGSANTRRHATPEGLERPRFRQDLVAEQIDEAGARFIDVMDPESGSLFRFYEVEYSIACAMDGERDVPGIVRWAQEELGLTPSPSEVKTVIATLGSLGYLEAAGAAAVEIATSPDVDLGEATEVGQIPVPPGEHELAPGIVVGKLPQPDAASNVELGLTEMAAAAASEAMPKAPDYALGAPGSTAKSRVPAPAAEELALGASGPSQIARPAAEAIPPTGDMSLDLSDHLAIKPDDVKEAVRASRVMNTPEVTPELLAALEDKPEPVVAKAEPPPKPPQRKSQPIAKQPEPVVAKQPEPVAKQPAKQPEPVVAKQPEPVKPEAKKPVEVRPAQKPTKPAVELPPAAPVVDKAQTPRPVAPRSGVSAMTVVLLILLVLTAGGFFAWKYLLNNPDDTDESAEPVRKRHVAKPVPKPVEPPPIGGKLALETPPTQDLSALTAGAIESLEPTGKLVAADEIVVRLAGAKALETEIAGLQKDLDSKAKPDLDKATADLATATSANNKDAIAKAQVVVAERQKGVEDKQAKITAKIAELAKFVIKAPAEGKLATAAKVGQHVAASEAIAKLAPNPVLSIVLKAPALAAGSPVALAVKNSDKTIACKVASVDGDNAKVTCQTESTVGDGTEVTLVK